MQKRIKPGFGRRSLLKSSLALTALASPPIIRARGETPVRIGMVDPLTGILSALAASEVEGAKYAVERVKQEERHSGPPGRASGRGLRQRRRHRRAEDPQADRARQGRRHLRRRELRHRLRDGAGHQRAESVPHRPRRPYRPDHRHRLQMERLSHLQHNRRWTPPRSPATGEALRQEILLHHARLCLWPHAAGQLHQEPEGAGRRVSGAKCCRSTPPTSRPR